MWILLILLSFNVFALDAVVTVLESPLLNAKNLDALGRIEFKQGNGVEPLTDITEPFLIVTNPPYIPDGTTLMRDVAEFEPQEALFAGKEGMDVIREILDQAKFDYERQQFNTVVSGCMKLLTALRA